MRKPRFRETEAIAKVLESVTGSALTHPAPGLQHESDALPNSGPLLLPFLLDSTLVVFLRGDISSSWCWVQVVHATQAKSQPLESCRGSPGSYFSLLACCLHSFLLLRPWVTSGPPGVLVPSCAAVCTGCGLRTELLCLTTWV